MVYLIGFNLIAGRNYEKLIAMLKKMNGTEILDAVWLCETGHGPKELSDIVGRYVDLTVDRVMVTEIRWQQFAALNLLNSGPRLDALFEAVRG